MQRPAYLCCSSYFVQEEGDLLASHPCMYEYLCVCVCVLCESNFMTLFINQGWILYTSSQGAKFIYIFKRRSRLSLTSIHMHSTQVCHIFFYSNLPSDISLTYPQTLTIEIGSAFLEKKPFFLKIVEVGMYVKKTFTYHWFVYARTTVAQVLLCEHFSLKHTSSVLTNKWEEALLVLPYLNMWEEALVNLMHLNFVFLCDSTFHFTISQMR